MEPTLADDEARLGTLAANLAAAVESTLAPWLVAAARARAAAAGHRLDETARARIDEVAAEVAAALGPRVRLALEADVDRGTASPLAEIRDGTVPVTAVLAELGVPPTRRDEFAVRVFPDDTYDLGPASFADIDESLREPGILWGAARAHVHLRRRRDAEGRTR